jgi:hypothetical protein
MKTKFLLLLAVLLLPWLTGAQTLTTISDTLYTPTGAPANGTITITVPVGFTAADGSVVPQNTTITATVTNGVLSVGLIPNIGSNPSGSY